MFCFGPVGLRITRSIIKRLLANTNLTNPWKFKRDNVGDLSEKWLFLEIIFRPNCLKLSLILWHLFAFVYSTEYDVCTVPSIPGFPEFSLDTFVAFTVIFVLFRSRGMWGTFFSSGHWLGSSQFCRDIQALSMGKFPYVRWIIITYSILGQLSDTSIDRQNAIKWH